MSLKQHWTNWRKKVSHSLFLNLKSTFWREGTFIKIWARKRHLGQTLFKLEFDLQDFVRVWINAIELLENFVIDFSQLGTVNFCQSRSLTCKFIIEMNSFHILKILHCQNSQDFEAGIHGPSDWSGPRFRNFSRTRTELLGPGPIGFGPWIPDCAVE